LVIKRFSMDKGLQSDFTLEGGRAVKAPLMASSSSTMVAPANYSQPGSNGTHFNNYTQSAFGTDSPYSSANASQVSQMAWQTRDNMAYDNTTGLARRDSIVAYYIQPGGRIVSVNLHPNARRSGEMGSTSDLGMQHFNATAATESGSRYDPSSESLLQEVRAGDQLGPYPAEYEAGITNVTPAWIPTR
jgi:hypothetical protein